MGKNQWYVHLSRTDGADLGHIKSVLADLRPPASPSELAAIVRGSGETSGADDLAQPAVLRAALVGNLDDREALMGFQIGRAHV